jgi:hypothetical protein
MSQLLTRAALCICVPGISVLAQDADAFRQAAPLRLIYAQFDPLHEVPEVPAALRAGADSRLWIVQFAGLPTQASRDSVRESGGEVHGYLPDNAYVVRMDAEAAAIVRTLAGVRWVGSYHPAYRLEPELVAEHRAGTAMPPRRFNVVVVDKRLDKPALGRAITAMGGTVDDEQQGSLLFTVTLTQAQLLQAAALDQVLWIDRWTPAETDMDNARIQGGGNYIETQGGFTGAGVNVHIYEGIEATHTDFTGGATNVSSGGGADDHGHATAGIVFGNGTSSPAVRGMAPDCTKFYTQYSSVVGSRWQVVSDLVNIHQVSHTTASWGNTQTTAYTSVSAEADDIIFDHDITWTQSQSNTGNRNSRPQAWAKNIFSIGGVQHFDNSSAADDSWDAGGASIGPAADGRIKPDLCAYYDAIGTSDRTGAAGYTTGNFYTGFGGTSGATPIVAGHDVLAIQMFTDGIFGNTLRNPGGSRHSNRPHFTTLKALQIVSASQYAFTSASTDNRREHQGWGFPSLQRMYDNRAKTFIVDETDVLTQGSASRWNITVGAGESELKICMTHNDPAGNPAVLQQQINNLSIRVTSPSGTVYWGNNGLTNGNYSAPGGAEDNVNPLECVFVQNPQAGVWFVDVKATLVAQDSHVETPAVDADYGLVVSGGTGAPGIPPVFASFETFGQGCPGSVPAPSYCVQLNGNGGTLASLTRTNEYAYQVVSSGTLQVTGFDIYTRSTSAATQVIGAYIYANAGTLPAVTPLATTTISVGPTAGFYTATFAAPVTVTGTFYLSINTSAQNVVLSQLTSGGSAGAAFFRSTPLSGAWGGQSTIITTPSWRVSCSGGQAFETPAIGNQGLPAIGTSYAVQVAKAAPSTGAIALLGLSDQAAGPLTLPFALPGAPGCNLLVSPDNTTFTVTSATGTASSTINVPNVTSLVSIVLFHQWAVADAVNSLGIVVSNAGKSTIGS